MNLYFLAKTLHLISMTAWMAGMFYLPRLFAYHADTKPGSEISEQFKIMERRLLRVIINPAMIATFIFGGWLLVQVDYGRPLHWFDAKFALVLVLATLHGFFARTRKKLARDERPRSAKFYKVINEMVTLVFMAIVALAVFKPF